jgi:hypothetical protein
MLGLLISDPPGRQFAALAKDRRTALYVMGVSRKNVDVPFVQHPLGPVSGRSPKVTSKGASGDLHPDTRPHHPLDCRIVGLYP